MSDTIADQKPAERELHTPAMSHCPAETPKYPQPISGPTNNTAVHGRTTEPGAASRGSRQRNRFVKVRLSAAEYAVVARYADLASVAMSEYMRGKVLAIHQTLDIRAELAALRELLRTAGPQAPTKPDPLVTEIVLLLREYIGSRDAQAIARARAKMPKGGA